MPEKRSLEPGERHAKLSRKPRERRHAVARAPFREWNKRLSWETFPIGRGDAVDLEPARIAEAKQLRGLVERLASRIVKRLANDLVLPVFRHIDPDRVSARDGEAEHRADFARIGELRRRVVGRIVDEGRMEMRLDVVYSDQRNAERLREPLRRVEPDDERRREARTVGNGDCIYRLAFHRVADDLRDLLDVRARGDLGNDAAVGLVQGDLRVDDVGEDFASVLHHRRRRLVAACLYPKNVHGFVTRTSTTGGRRAGLRPTPCRAP